MSGKKCKHCGSSEIEVDPARGDAVCTSCGTVLEDNIIVAEVEFQENAHGGASAIGQFVSADSKGGATGFGRAFNVGIGQESREVTLRKARDGITMLCQQLRLNQQCIDIACNFFKMALTRHLTIGRPASHTQAACVYMTCRTEGTAHLLIDISDALQICCYQLGRTYFRLSRALCIQIPPTDPCLYIIRFASQLQLDDKQHEVSMTALRLVQRMKRDSIHSGRRPSGICGAALLIAARLHNFSRTPVDVVRIVKVHESTIRKRLMEFGDTPSSSLTLEEFMTVDLEEEQDPPAFRAARKRDKERLQKLMEEEDGEKEITELQREIEQQLEKDSARRRKALVLPSASDEASSEIAEAERFAAEDTLMLIDQMVETRASKQNIEKGLGPDLALIGLGAPEEKADKFLKPEPKLPFTKDLNADELELSQKDEDYLSSLIMTDEEARHKTIMWNTINKDYLKNQKIKEELRAKELAEGKKKKVRGSYKKRTIISGASAGEAIGKILAEKKISSKINYDILKSLDEPGSVAPATPKPQAVVEESKPQTPKAPEKSPIPKKRKKKNAPNTLPARPSKVATLPVVLSPATPTKPATPSTPTTPSAATTSGTNDVSAVEEPATPSAEFADDYEDEVEPEPTYGTESLAAMLQNGDDNDYYEYEEEY